MTTFTGEPRRDFEKATAEIVKLKDRILGYQERIDSLRGENDRLREKNELQRAKYEERLAEKDAVIKELSNRLAHVNALLGHDGSNTGTPTSQTPARQKKLIPNSRRGSGKRKGGQPGHPKAALKVLDESEITDIVGHPLRDGECCPNCGLVDFTPTGDSEVKYE